MKCRRLGVNLAARRGRRVGTGAAALAFQLCVAGGIQAQRPCSFEARAGFGRAMGDQLVHTGGPTNRLQSGVLVAVGGACGVGRVGAGAELEAAVGGYLDLYRFLGALEVPIAALSSSGSPSFVLGVRAVAGWTLTMQTPGAYTNVLAFDTWAFDPGTSGPVVGAGVRASVRLGERTSLVLSAGWRASHLHQSYFAGEGADRRRRKLTHSLPLAVGVRIGSLR